MALVEMAQVPEAFVEVTVCSSEGQCSLVGRRRRVLYKNVMQENNMASLGVIPAPAVELLTHLERREEAWVPDLQSSDESADEGPVKPPLKQLPKGGMWRSPVTYASSDSSNSDDELESEAEEEKPQRGGQRLMVIHRNLLASSKGDGSQNLKLKPTCQSGPQRKKHPPNRAGAVGESSAKERAAAGDHRNTCPDCGQSFRSKLSLSNHQRKHTRENPYKCSCCGERFTAKKVLAAHQMRHAEEKGYKHPSSMKTTTKLQIVNPEERPHRCTQCGKSFKVKFHLARHEKSHSKERPYKCSSCERGFIQKVHLTKHKKIHRRQKNCTSPKTVKLARVESSPVAPKKKLSIDPERAVALNTRHQRFSLNRYECQFCGRCMRAKSLLVAHERSHRDERRYKCSHCNKSFYHKHHFEKHKRIHLRRQPDCRPPKRMKRPSAKSSPSDCGNFHTTENPSKSPVDRKIVTRNLHLAQRLKRLCKTKVFKCQYCGKCMSQRSSLVNHERIHRGERPYKCQDCGESFRRKHHLDRHLVTHRSGKTLKHRKKVKRLNVKSSLPVPGGINTRQKPDKDLVEEHIVTHSSRFTRQPETHTDDELYRCKFCGKVLQTKNSFLRHERSHKGAKPYTCLECGKKFSQKNYLGHHQRSHMRKKPFKCSDYEKRLTRKNTPLSCGSPQKRKLPFSCLKCGKSFHENYYLMRHQRIHTGAKPFKCATCGKGFIQTWHLRRHERVHLKERNRKQPAEPVERQLFRSPANGISSERKAQKDPPVNINGQKRARAGEGNTSPSLKVAKRNLLAALQGSEMVVSHKPEQGEIPTEGETKHQALLPRKGKRKDQENQRDVNGQLLPPMRGWVVKGDTLLHNEQSKNDLGQLVQPTKCPKKIILQGLENEKVHADQPLEECLASPVRKSKREAQLAGKPCKSCFCQKEEPGMTPGRKSKETLTCTKVKPDISLQRKSQVNVSSNMSKRLLKSPKLRNAILDEQSQPTFSAESKMEADENPVLGNSASIEQQEVLGKRAGGNLVSPSYMKEKSESVDISELQTLPRLPESHVENSSQQVRAKNELKSTAVHNLGMASANWQFDVQPESLKTVEKHIPQWKARTSDDQQGMAVKREPETDASEGEVGITPGRSEKLACTKCKMAFRSRVNLMIHEDYHTRQRPFQCSQCVKRFCALPTLNVHMRIHTGEKPFKCSECPFRCNVSSNLSRHKRTHIRQRPQACHLCEKRFWFSHSLLLHLKTHSEEAPYECSDCGRVFTHRNFLNLHRRFKHSSETPEWPKEEQHPHSPGEDS